VNNGPNTHTKNTHTDNVVIVRIPGNPPVSHLGYPLGSHSVLELFVVVVVVVVMTSPSGTAYMGGQMSRRDEEFHQTLNPEGSISPS